LRLTLVGLSLFVLVISKAQEVYSSGGDYFKGSNYSIGFTIGEPINETFSKSANNLTQGFQQGKLTVSIYELPGLNNTIKVFPNPVHEFVIIKLNNLSFNNLRYEFYNEDGKLLYRDLMNSTETEISTSQLMASTYFIKILDNQFLVKSFKIVKQ
jgi:hypothetical protein